MNEAQKDELTIDQRLFGPPASCLYAMTTSCPYAMMILGSAIG